MTSASEDSAVEEKPKKKEVKTLGRKAKEAQPSDVSESEGPSEKETAKPRRKAPAPKSESEVTESEPEEMRRKKITKKLTKKEPAKAGYSTMEEDTMTEGEDPDTEAKRRV